MRSYFVVAALALAGCYSPKVLDCQYECSAQGNACPSGMNCLDGLCTAGPACTPDGAKLDAAIDALPPPVCPLREWCTELNKMPDELLTGIWGASPDNIWVVGDHGTILHRTLAGWTNVSPPTLAGVRLTDVTGLDTTHIYISGTKGTLVVGDGARFETADIADSSVDLNGVAVTTAEATPAVWLAGVAGSNAVSYYVNGSTLLGMPIAPIPTSNFLAVSPWGAVAAQKIVAVTIGGEMYTKPATSMAGTWTKSQATITGGLALNDALSAAGTADYRVVGPGGITKISGTVVTTEVVGSTSTMFQAIDGTETNMWAVGTSGARAKTGLSWDVANDTKAPKDLTDVLVFPNDVFVVGKHGLVAHRRN